MRDYLNRILFIPEASIVVTERYLNEMPDDLFDAIPIIKEPFDEFISTHGIMIGILRKGTLYSIYICSPSYWRSVGTIEKD